MEVGFYSRSRTGVKGLRSCRGSRAGPCARESVLTLRRASISCQNLSLLPRSSCSWSRPSTATISATGLRLRNTTTRWPCASSRLSARVRRAFSAADRGRARIHVPVAVLMEARVESPAYSRLSTVNCSRGAFSRPARWRSPRPQLARLLRRGSPRPACQARSPSSKRRTRSSALAASSSLCRSSARRS